MENTAPADNEIPACYGIYAKYEGKRYASCAAEYQNLVYKV